MAEKTEDLNLPVSVISRIIKESLPDGVLVSKEARTAVARAASVFVLHATTHANQNAFASKRKTITAGDVIQGVRELDMDDFVEPLQVALEEWRKQQSNKSAAKKAAKEGKKGVFSQQVEEDGDDDEPPVLTNSAMEEDLDESGGNNRLDGEGIDQDPAPESPSSSAAQQLEATPVENEQPKTASSSGSDNSSDEDGSGSEDGE